MSKQLRNLLSFLPLLIAILMVSLAFLWPSRQSQRPLHFELILKSSANDNEFWQMVQYGARTAARDYQVQVQITGPRSETDVESQNRLVYEALEREPSAILLAPLDLQASLPAAQAVRSQGIPLVTLDSDLAEDLSMAHVGTDNLRAGQKLAELVQVYSEPMDKVAIIAHVATSSTAKERIEGLKLGLSGSPRELIGPFYCNSNRETAKELCQQLLTVHPDLKLIVGTNEWSACGAGDGVEALNLKDQVHVIGFDSSPTEASFIEKGIFKGVVVQKAFNIGYQSIETAVQLMQGKVVPKRLDSGSEKITLDTLHSPEGQKSMFPFIAQD